MTIKSEIDFECFQCHKGIMEKLPKPHSYDFNKEGFVPRVCNNCGICNNTEHIIPHTGVVKTKFSNKYIETVLRILCNCQKRFSYQILKLLKNRLRDRNICCAYTLAELIVLEANDFNVNLNWDVVIHTIYARSGAYLHMDSYA